MGNMWKVVFLFELGRESKRVWWRLIFIYSADLKSFQATQLFHIEAKSDKTKSNSIKIKKLSFQVKTTISVNDYFVF